MKLSDKEILYLDNHLIIVNKPSQLITQPTNLSQDSMETRVKAFLKERFQKKGEAFAHVVHRLDRVASGIVVCARTSKALSRLNEQIRKGLWKKKYLLRYEGELPHQSGTLIHFLERQAYRSVVTFEGKGKRAELHYNAIGDHRAEVELITGRYHQIRVQMAAIGCPICGDEKYGSTVKAKSSGIDLCHIELAFSHPVTKNLLIIKIDPPF